MPNGKEINSQLEFEEHIGKMTPDEKQDFIARQVWKLSAQMSKLPCRTGNDCPSPKDNIEKRIESAAWPTAFKWVIGVFGTLLIAILIAVINHVTK